MTPYFKEQLGCEGSMSQHDTLTLEPCPFCGALPDARDAGDYFVSCPSCGIDGPAGLSDGREAAANAWNRRAALSATQPAQAAQSEPVKPLFASKVASRKWSELQEAGARMQSIAFDGHKSGQPGTIDPWGVVRWGQAAQGAGEVVAGIIAEWRDVILNARHNMDGVLDNDQINEVLNVWDDMAIEVERALGTAMPSNAQAQLRAVEKLIDGSQPIDIPGALAVIRHGGTTPPPAQQPEAVPSEQSGWCVYVAGMVAGWLGMDVDDPKIPTMGAIIERRLWALKRDTPPAQAAADARDAGRYRYLRNRVPAEVLGQLKRAAGCWIDCEDDDGVLTLLTGHDADAAIDAAIATHQQRQDGGDA